MFHFFYGSNTYLTKKKINACLESFRSKNGDFGIETIAGDKITLGSLKKIVFTRSFFGDQKLIVIENMLLSKTDPAVVESIVSLADRIPETVDLYLVEYGVPDKRSAGYKKLSKISGAQEFLDIDPPTMVKMVIGKFKQADIGIEREAAIVLAENFCGDLWKAENESKKIIDYARANNLQKIDLISLENISVFARESKVFDFIDYLSTGNIQKAQLELGRLRQNGEDNFYIHSMIVYQYRNLLFLADGKERGTIGAVKINPYVASKLRSALGRYTLSELKIIYEALGQIDFEAKTGRNELDLLIDLFVAKSYKEVI
ncbi:MAG: hypothetical protein WCG48_04230 [Candidatus Berkelbacteria bacterium]